jgi:thiamine biosynthesis lipoprotein
LQGAGFEQLKIAADHCIAEARRFEAKYSRYTQDSVTTRINTSAGKAAIVIDFETCAILQYAAVCYEQSDGLFDITSGVLRRVWNKSRTTLPTDADLIACTDLIGWDKVKLDEGSVQLPVEGMEIDFGGVVKEYAADALSVLARSQGIRHGLVNLGGDISIIGPNMNETGAWPIGIVHPTKPDAAIAVIPLIGGAIATSGGYERYFEIKGKRYSHLINPRTGWPVDSLLSVSVAAGSALVSGSISTIALLKGQAEGISWLEQCESTYFAIDRDLQFHGNLNNDHE